MSQQKLTTITLREAGLKLAEQDGRPLCRDVLHKRSQIYLSQSGHRIRLRTTNDRVLTVTASSTKPAEATLDFEDCCVLLLVMPTERRGTSAVEAYWVPSTDAARDVKTAHQRWLDSNPNTKSANKTYSIWFDEAMAESGMFREKWSQYRLPATLRLSE